MRVVAPVLGVLSGGLTAAVLHYRQVVKSRSLPFLPSHIEAVDHPDVFVHVSKAEPLGSAHE